MFVVVLLLAYLARSVLGGSASDKLWSCCTTDPEIDPFCAQKYCNFAQISQQSVLPFITECSNKGNTISRIWDCISSRHDHSECCVNQGVLPLCQAFCDARNAVPTDVLRYGGCMFEFEKYRLCFRTFLRHNPPVRGG